MQMRVHFVLWITIVSVLTVAPCCASLIYPDCISESDSIITPAALRACHLDAYSPYPTSDTNHITAAVQRFAQSTPIAQSQPLPPWITPQSHCRDWSSHETDANKKSCLHELWDWQFCGPRPPTLAKTQSAVHVKQAPIEIEAGALTYEHETDTAYLTVGARVQQADQFIESSTLIWQRQQDLVLAPERVVLGQATARILGSHGQFNLKTHQGQLFDVHYRFTGAANLRGQAQKVKILNQQTIQLEELIYTACAPEDNTWTLHAKQLTLDQKSGQGVAHHAWLKIKDIPVLYTPYLSFPIDSRRKSGFLIPIFSSSDETGFDLSLPYYINIAPAMDATITPRLTSKRGLMLGGEFRYLTAFDHGQISAEVIPRDPLYRDSRTLRGILRIEETGQFGRHWRTDLDYNLVSDKTYLEDFGNRLDVTSTRHLPQRLAVTYLGAGWSALLRGEAFQTLDTTLSAWHDPYDRLPQLILTMKPRMLDFGLQLALQAEYDYFHHIERENGHRFTIQPQLSWPMHRSYGHLIPSVRLTGTHYKLDDRDDQASSSIQHLIPTMAVDGQLIFERPMTWFKQDALQTVEPRLFYLYTPYHDQQDAPIFDSSELTFHFANLFRTNRFTGYDRIGDAHQLTIGLTTRILNAATGQEQIRASIGQIHYFTDRRVQFYGAPPETRSESPFAGEFVTHWQRYWSGRASFEWDRQQKEQDGTPWRKRTLELHYQHPNQQLMTAAYRYDAGVDPITGYEDTDVAFRWPVTDQVNVVGRWLYSMRYEQTMEAVAGIQFGQCCWRLSVIGRHFKNTPNTEGSTSVMVQLELAGLGQIGNSVDRFLSRDLH
jgi:LPS-assembly protein